MAEVFVSNPGSSKAPEFSPKVGKDGVIELVVSGERDIQSEIQSHAASCDIRNIMQRYMLGDTSVLSRVQGFYGDICNLPKSHAEWLQRAIDGQALFSSLPADVRLKFGNDVNRFLSTAGSKEWLDSLGLSSDPVKLDAVKSDSAE